MSIVSRILIMNFLIILTVLTLSGKVSATEYKDKVKLTVFYESYCSDSVRFIVNQLHSTWQDLKQFIRLELIPFGFAKQWYEDGHFMFSCQHGPNECLGNMLHACAVFRACGPTGSLDCPVSNLSRAVNYINCVMQERDQWDATEQCASSEGLTRSDITYCARSTLGETLESGYGNITTAYNSSQLIDYIPFIVINDIHTKEEQEEAETNLTTLICRYIPDKCKSMNLTPSRTFI